jgi:selenide, water dikinase
MQTNQAPVVKDLVLVGGGHAHVTVLKRFAMNPLPGLRVTLITRDIHTPYSGMVPGYIAGFYNYDDCHIDLGKLARFANARLYHASVKQLDVENKQVHVEGRPAIRYDLLSINTGSRPDSNNIPGVDQYALSAKPVDRFLDQWNVLMDRVQNTEHPLRIVVVGGGAGGIELALSTQLRLQNTLSKAGKNPELLQYTLLSASEHIMHQHNDGVQRRFERILKQRNITLHCSKQVSEVKADQVITRDGQNYAADVVIWATSASTADWPREAGLAVDEKGFISVQETLQSTSHPDIFAAGDVASLPNPRPKSGVFAVRQGPVLADNLRAAATQKPLRVYRAQRHFLGLISTGNQYAVASRGNWSYESAWLWKVKDWIDRRFMQKFNQLPQMKVDHQPHLAEGITDADTLKILSTQPMRCGGCGAKVGASVLSRVMKRLPLESRADVLIGREKPDDCAMFTVPADKAMVQSVDYFRAFINDSFTFGAIAANHALGDLYAMGAEPQSALAIATVPYASEKIVEENLFDLLSGAMSMLQPCGAVLAGGHSSEGIELAFGLTVNGLINPSLVMKKQGLQAGDKIILTKAIGTGTLFAAEMQAKAKGRWIDAAIQSMLVSSLAASHCLKNHSVSACTDLTGFGLTGHLFEMMTASNVDAEIILDALPLLDGAQQCIDAGILSSLQPQNLRLRRAIHNFEQFTKHPLYPLLFDPQTAGGLLAGIPAQQANDCLQQLHNLGYKDAAIIGQVVSKSEEQPSIKIHK